MEMAKKSEPVGDKNHLTILLPVTLGPEASQTVEKSILSQLSPATRKLVFDCSKTEVIFSAGISLLIKFRRKILEMGGAIALVNVSAKLKESLALLSLDRVFPIYSTNLESLRLSEIGLSENRTLKNDNKFIFVAQIESQIYRLTLSGIMSSLYDLSAFANFSPAPDIIDYLLNLENLEIVDTFGAQIIADFLDKRKEQSGRTIIFSVNQMILDVFKLFPSLATSTIVSSEAEALELLETNLAQP